MKANSLMGRVVFAVAGLVLALSVRAESPATQPGRFGGEAYRFQADSGEIIAVLDNGMTVIAKRVKSPVLAVRAYAKTGGVYEGQWLGGGLSHLLEHLVAGGSNKRRTEEQNRNLLQKIGNDSNAYTTYDHTCYYVNTTPDHLDDAVDLVSGWMLGADITPAEYAREYEVVQRELEMNKGEPDSIFWHLRQYNRYRVHPARIPVIGYQEVIEGLSRDDVYNYYRLAYQANNLLFAVAGDIDPEVALAVVRRNVAEAPAGRVFDHSLPLEPPVLAPRTVSAKMPNLGQARLDLSFPTITSDHPDLYALDLLAAVLGMGESSILVEEIRDRLQIASDISAYSYTPNFVDGSFSVALELAPDKIEAASRAVIELLEACKLKPIEDSRIARAKTMIRTARVKEQQTSEQIVSTMATDLLQSGDPQFSRHYVERIEQVTAEQLMAAAQKYLEVNRLLTTSLVPAESAVASETPDAAQVLAAGTDKVSKVALPNGVILLHKRISTTPIVEVSMYALGGLTAEDEQSNGLGNLTMSMLPRGTRTRPAQEIAQFFDSIGGDLNTSCGNNTWSWSMTCLKDDAAAALEVFGDVVSHPAFPQAELDNVAERVRAAIRDQDSDWHSEAMRFFRRSFFGENSPYRFVATGSAEVVERANSEQLRAWYTTKVLTAPRVIAIFGDLPLEQAQQFAMQYLSAGEPIAPPQQRQPAREVGAGSAVPSVVVDAVEVKKTEKPLAGVVIGFKSASTVGDAAQPALDVMDTMTSGWTYPTGYLHDTLRGRGLVYVVHAYTMPGRNSEMPGSFVVYAGCEPGNVNQVVDLILENIARCQGSAQDMQKDWFDRSRQLIVTGQALANETPAQQAQTAVLDELYGLGFDFSDRFGERIKAVTIEQIQQTARARLSRCVVTVCTPQPELVNRGTGQRQYTSFPLVELAPAGVAHSPGK